MGEESVCVLPVRGTWRACLLKHMSSLKKVMICFCHGRCVCEYVPIWLVCKVCVMMSVLVRLCVGGVGYFYVLHANRVNGGLHEWLPFAWGVC